MLKILETVWLIIGIAGIAFCIYALVNGENEKSVYFAVFTAISGIMFYIRRRQRIRIEKDASEPPQK